MKNISSVVCVVKRGLTEIRYGFFKTLANPTRLAILETLRKEDLTVGELADRLGQQQSMISHNIKPLEKCRLIYTERQGKSKLLKLNHETVGSIFDAVERHAQNHCPWKGDCPDAR